MTPREGKKTPYKALVGNNAKLPRVTMTKKEKNVVCIVFRMSPNRFAPTTSKFLVPISSLKYCDHDVTLMSSSRDSDTEQSLLKCDRKSRGVFVKEWCSQNHQGHDSALMTMTMMVVLSGGCPSSRAIALIVQNIHFISKAIHKTVPAPKMKILHHRFLASSTPFLLVLCHAVTTAAVSGSSSTPLSRAEVLKGQARGVNPRNMHGMVSFARTCFYICCCFVL